MASQLTGKTAPGVLPRSREGPCAKPGGSGGQRVVICPAPDSTMTWRRMLSDVVHGRS